jgi:hypothetical protein
VSHNSTKDICHLRGSGNVPIIVFTRPAVHAKGGIARVGLFFVTTKLGRLILAVFARERLVTPTRSGTIAAFDKGTVVIGNHTAYASVEANLVATRCTRDFAQRTKKTVWTEAVHQGLVEIVFPIILVFSKSFLIVLETELTRATIVALKMALGDRFLGVFAMRPLVIILTVTRPMRVILAAFKTQKKYRESHSFTAVTACKHASTLRTSHRGKFHH